MSRLWIERWDYDYVPRAITPLICTLQTDPSPAKRKEAAWLLSGVRTFRSIVPLIQALQDESLLVQKEAMKTLTNIANNEKIASKNKLLTLFENLQSEDPSTKEEALVTLNEMAVRFATDYLESDYNIYRRIGLEEFIGLGQEARIALPHLIRALADEDFFVRRGAIELLSDIGGNEIIPYL